VEARRRGEVVWVRMRRGEEEKGRIGWLAEGVLSVDFGGTLGHIGGISDKIRHGTGGSRRCTSICCRYAQLDS
jgi:hypothetical protein